MVYLNQVLRFALLSGLKAGVTLLGFGMTG